MIVEFFGPPGVGKSTFADALAASLRERGCAVQMMASYRPAETAHSKDSRSSMAALRRLSRPTAEMFATAGHLLGHSREASAAGELFRLLPPKDVIWSIRLRQYVWRLLRSWHLASSANHVALFDQGFVQAVCSLALLGRTADKALIARALASIPQPDLLIRLTAPADILEARLSERQRRQGRIERLFELDLKTNLRCVPIIAELDDLLREQGREVARADCTDRHSLSADVDRLAHEITTKRSVGAASKSW